MRGQQKTYNLRRTPPRRPPASRTKHTIHGAIVGGAPPASRTKHTIHGAIVRPENPEKTYNSTGFAWLAVVVGCCWLSTTHPEAPCGGKMSMMPSETKLINVKLQAENWIASRSSLDVWGLWSVEWCLSCRSHQTLSNEPWFISPARQTRTSRQILKGITSTWGYAKISFDIVESEPS